MPVFAVFTTSVKYYMISDHLKSDVCFGGSVKAYRSLAIINTAAAFAQKMRMSEICFIIAIGSVRNLNSQYLSGIGELIQISVDSRPADIRICFRYHGKYLVCRRVIRKRHDS